MPSIKSSIFLLLILFCSNKIFAQNQLHFSIEESAVPNNSKHFFKADDSLIQYYGRLQNSNPALPRFWSPGVYIKAKFDGNECSFFLNDQVLYGNVHNYIETVSYTHLRAHETGRNLVCRL